MTDPDPMRKAETTANMHFNLKPCYDCKGIEVCAEPTCDGDGVQVICHTCDARSGVFDKVRDASIDWNAAWYDQRRKD